MRSRPLVLFFMAAAYLLIAASFPVQIYFLYEHTLSELPQVLSKLTILNWLVIAGLSTGSILFYRGSTKMVPAAIGISFLVLGNNIIVGLFGEDFNIYQTVLASGVFASLHLSLRNSEVQKLIQQPELRWWRTAYRQKLKIPITMRTKNYHQLIFDTFDISDSGIFVAVSNQEIAGLSGLTLNESVELTMKFDSLNQIKCQARLARISKGSGKYPSGLGIEFTDLSDKDRKRIHRFRAKLLPEATPNATALFTNT